MVQIRKEKHIEILRKHIKSSLFILLFVSAIFFSYSSFHVNEEDPDLVEWKCPSCSQFPTSFTKPPPPSPPPTPTTISHLVFAIGASAATWSRRSSYAGLWWDPLTMRGHVWLDAPSPSPSYSGASPPVKISPRNFSRFGDRASASRIARIVADSYELGLEGVRWFVMGDDDTVFFTENLVGLLGRLDHEEMYYVGAESESVEQDEMHSYRMAFGGGGFAVSVGATRELAKVMDGCLDRYRWLWGSDQRVQACLGEVGVPLTRAPGFHQVDIRGNAYGMLAAHPIAPLISLHHLDAVKPISPLTLNQLDALKSLIHASKSDPARTLQQTICYIPDRSFNWSVSVSWGYTVQIYPWILPPTELEVPLLTFQSWRSYKDGPFVFNTRPFRSGKECERPILFFLDHVRVINKGIFDSTSSEYLRYDPPHSKGCGEPGFAAATRVESVRVFARRMDQNIWQKAPRRQCCETRRRKRGKTLEVKVRDCYPGEITSPP